MTHENRRGTVRLQIAVSFLVVLVLTVASLLSRRFFEQRTPEMPAGLSPIPPVISQGETMLFRVTTLQGEAEAYQNGQWYVVRAGHLLSSKDVIRTKSGARATLRRGSVEIELRDNMDLRLDDLEEETARVGLLRGGKVSASVVGNKQHVEITAHETRTVNVGPSRFVVSMSPSGKVNVATSEGAARFSAQGKDVLVANGNVSVAQPGQTPGEPEPIPEQLLLSVIWPEDDRLASQARVRGKAQPSSRINVNGIETEVGPRGGFTTHIPLKIGKNLIQIEAEDIAGHTKSIEKVLTREAPAPTLLPSDKELWNP